ncbi:MAG TPA: azurin [Salinimicrobium catena]|uniref:Azurin n=1 Tax=Salinimicrobium catena TaxID=390640 RepID=A0A7C2R0U3_9FLAO|nr:azurin [Salinimicrobium catena]
MNTHIIAISLAFLLGLTGISFDRTGESEVNISEVTSAAKAVVINSNDQMRFDKSEIRVKAGEKIKLTLNHTGKLPKTAMGHNFVLLEKGVDMADFAMKAMNAKDREYIPAKGVIAHTKLIGGGESTTIEFTAPAKGTYEFLCSFPGHYAMMKGKFIVE